MKRAFALLALVLTACPGAREPERPLVTLPTLDTSNFTAREKRELSDHLTQLPAPCAEVAVPVAQCVQEKRACGRCEPAARALWQMVRDGMSRDQVVARYTLRWDPAKAQAIPIDGSPVRGPEDAPVTIVEFADFECPSCERMFPVLERVLSKHKEKVRFVYKFLPIGIHPHAEPAARAAFAAQKQGKFWEMHKRLFESFGKLEQRDLEQHATELGLNIDQFRADMKSNEAGDRLARDRELAQKLGAKHTPTLFVNGHMFDHQSELDDWVKVELEGR
jgi:protein-disulfide isomerase